MNVRNLEKLRRRLDELNEQKFNMQFFFKNSNLLERCICGEACLMAGYEPLFLPGQSTTRYCHKESIVGVQVPRKCWDVGSEILDLTAEEQNWLFRAEFGIWHEDDFEFCISRITLKQATAAIDYLLDHRDSRSSLQTVIVEETGRILQLT